MKFSENLDHGPRNRWFRFDDDPDSGGTLTSDLWSQVALIIKQPTALSNTLNYRWKSQNGGRWADGGSLWCFLFKSVLDWGIRVAAVGLLDGTHLSAFIFRCRYQIHTLLFYLEPTTITVLVTDWLHLTTSGPVTQLEPPSSGPSQLMTHWSYASGVILQHKYVWK